jgi:photosystem II stability/assembly factor-like uncharacterized protein
MPTPCRTRGAQEFHAFALIAALLLLGGIANPPAAQAALEWEALGPWGESIRVFSLAIDPRFPDTVYAGADQGGLFKSLNAGKSWVRVSTGLPNCEVWAIAIDPVSSGTLYVGMAGEQGGVYRSADSGRSWISASAGLTAASVFALAIERTRPNILYAGTFTGVFKSTNGGESWTPVSPPISVGALVFDPNTAATLYAGTDHGVYKTTDGGANWTEMNTGFYSRSVSTLAHDPLTTGILYAVTGEGLFKSTDGGANWVGNSPFPPFLITGLPRVGIYCLAVDPIISTTLYAGTFREGIFKSTDGGMNWSPANTGIGNDSIVYSLAVNPVASNTIYAGIAGDGFLKSSDAAASWTRSITGMTNSLVFRFLSDPLNPHRLLVGGLEGAFASADDGASWTAISTGLTDTVVYALSVDPANSTILYAGTRAGVFRSVDGGAHWVSMGLASIEVLAIAVEPGNPKTMYAGSQSGIFKTTNGGMSWSPINDGMRSSGVSALIVDPDSPATLHAATSGGVFKTTNGGANWTLVSPAVNVNALAIAHKIPAVIYAGTWGNGVIKSMDGGATWGPASPAVPITALVLDPTTSTTLYVGALGMGVFKSVNGGLSWTAINDGLPVPNVPTLALDSHNPATLYAGTAASGVYRLRQKAVAPQFFLDVNQGSLQPGTEHLLRASLLSGEVSRVADVYLALQFPDGSLLYLRGDGSLSAEGQPIASVAPIPEYSGQLFAHTFTGSEPAGAYRWLGVYADPTTGILLDGIVESPVLNFAPSTELPLLSLTPNRAFLQSGDRHTLMVEVSPGTNPTVSDIYIAIQFPDGSLRFLREDGSLGDTATPRATGGSGEAGTYQVFSHTFTGTEPAGTYKWLAAFAAPGTLNWVGPIVQAPFSFMP